MTPPIKGGIVLREFSTEEMDSFEIEARFMIGIREGLYDSWTKNARQHLSYVEESIASLVRGVKPEGLVAYTLRIYD